MTYHIKGVELDETDMREVYTAYRQNCIAEEIVFQTNMEYSKAMDKALLVIDAMDNNHLTEGEAMEVVLCNLYL
jgi:hypothetical protein